MPEILSREDVVSAFREAMIDHYRAHSPDPGLTESTLTASDYLNRFQELVKLLEAVSAQLEDFAGEFLSWSPMSYEEHAAQAELDDLAARRQASSPIRARFDEAVAHLHGEAIAVVDDVVAKLSGSKQGLNLACDNAAACLRILTDEANAIARGETVPHRERQDQAGNVIYAQFGRR